ncbi:ER membrane protein complex subunit 6-like [Carya illinoinensis]|uniref:ER membrane protein complex subunit 6-like n=1 Tax=Carya illinoinensis TaxID=32201 RepID=UPI001C71AD8A|nr:ER membrane protein complex subunit 6-like [Carya illinoinensis]
MARHNEFSAAEKKSSDLSNDIPTFNVENLQSNMKIIYYNWTFLFIIGGVIARILGFTSLTGFILYFLIMAITSAGLMAKSGFSTHSYFDSWNRAVLDGFFSGLLAFLDMRSFAYDIVHIF